MRTKRVERLLKLIQALQSGLSRTVDDLAEHVGVSRRTIFRDLELLTRAGLPYVFDHETRRYSTDRVALLPPVTLSYAEALALLMATRYMLDHQAVFDKASAVAVGLKIESMLPNAMQDYCGLLLEHVEFKHDPASDTAAIVGSIPTLQMALVRRLKTRLKYDSYYDGRAIDVVVRPYRLAYIHRGWYLIGYCEEESAVRTFKVERILQLKILDETFKIDTPFCLDDYFGNAWLMIRGEQRYDVKIRFLKKVAANVDEIAWHKTQRTRFEEDGSLLFEVSIDGIDEIAWWVLGYGDQAHVLEPPQLREIVARHAERMASYYISDGRPAGGKE